MRINAGAIEDKDNIFSNDEKENKSLPPLPLITFSSKENKRLIMLKASAVPSISPNTALLEPGKPRRKAGKILKTISLDMSVKN